MNARTLLYPRLSRSWLPAMIRHALIGSLFAGSYGIIHDQITYAISPEYFSKLKFVQFRYADFGFPERIYVGEIGFLATWWVGLFTGWFLARVVVPKFPPARATEYVIQSFGTIAVFAIFAAFIGFLAGPQHRSDSDLSSWQALAIRHRIQDLPAFVQVAYIHNAGYVGALMGLIVAILRLNRMKESPEQLVKTAS